MKCRLRVVCQPSSGLTLPWIVAIAVVASLAGVACSPQNSAKEQAPPSLAPRVTRTGSAAGGGSSPAVPSVVSGPVAGSLDTGGSRAGAGGAGGSQAPDNTAGVADSGKDDAGVGASLPDALPCDVASVVAERCAGCHGQEPIGGAPMSLLTRADFSRKIKSIRTAPGMTEEVATLVKARINDAAMPMPPGELLPEPQRMTLNAWLDMGHPGASDGSSCPQPGEVDRSTAASSVTSHTQEDGSTCYQLRNHGKSEPGDTSPYTVPPGEQYVSFYFKAPWHEASELVSFHTLYDNRKILHHWLLYTTLGSDMDGTFAPSVGTHIGDSAQLLAGWAVGGNDVEMPQDVALRLPPPDSGVMVEWHYYNSGSDTEMDNSGIEICVLPEGTRAHTAGMTWLGTEDLNGPIGMPAKTVSEYGGTCLPSRTGMNDSDPIHIFTLWPHMHRFGRSMRSVVTRADGSEKEVFNKPFDFNYQVTYDTDIDIYPGDVITSTCTYENTSNASVPFGPSTNQEMCYQFAYSYPAGALDNGVPSLVGATNTCW